MIWFDTLTISQYPRSELIHGFATIIKIQNEAITIYGTEVGRISLAHAKSICCNIVSFAFCSNSKQPDDASITFFKLDSPFSDICVEKAILLLNIFFCCCEHLNTVFYISVSTYSLFPIKSESSISDSTIDFKPTFFHSYFFAK